MFRLTIVAVGTLKEGYLREACAEYEKRLGAFCKPEIIQIKETKLPDDPGAEPSLTEFRVLARGGGHALVEARPLTGRTHQLRVHFASLGHPIAGDDLYGVPDPRAARQMLHARSLVFPHPMRGDRMELTAPLPADLAALAADLFPAFPLT